MGSSAESIIVIDNGDYNGAWFYRTDYFTSKEAAIAKAEEMRQKKIVSLKKQIKGLEKMKFE